MGLQLFDNKQGIWYNMKRRLFLLGIASSLLFGCASKTIEYYIEGPNELKVMKEKLANKNEKIIDIRQDPQNKRFYIIKVKN
jgi:ABC-type glycerol-3-phosphate transport system substrate-binding protein